MIVLRYGKYISGLRIYRVGDVLPETPSAKSLVECGKAEIVVDMPKKSTKITKKPEPEKVGPTQENAQVNT